MAWQAENTTVKRDFQLSAEHPCVLSECEMYGCRELPVIGGFGVSRVVGQAPGACKADFTCLITDVRLATGLVPGCNYGL